MLTGQRLGSPRAPGAPHDHTSVVAATSHETVRERIVYPSLPLRCPSFGTISNKS